MGKKFLTPTDVRSLARAYTGECVRTLAGIMRQPETPAAARVTAAGLLLDRGWGRAPQQITGEDGGPLRIVIRQLSGSGEEKMIDVTPVERSLVELLAEDDETV